MKFKGIFCLIALIILLSCKNNNDEPEPTPPVTTTADSVAITINPASVKQEMIGFGGALTWYSNWLTANNKLNEMADVMFTDLGIDIIRFKNWYYPANYPTDKSITDMPDDNAKAAWDATNQLYQLAKARKPNVKVLLSSWGPPKNLKSNGVLQQGTLKSDNNGFMYDAFAQYWADVLDHVPFNPDYISIQNEPTYVNAGWTTCQWATTETTSLPSYMTAFNKVYDKIKTRNFVPVMIGPESQDITTFPAFANLLKDNPNCGMYSYHPYNINSSTTAANTITSLQSVGAFTNKPTLMTEFSDNLNWFNTAVFIQNSMIYANTSGYIYWKLMWNTPTTGEDAGMISVSSSSSSATYTVTPYYHLIKHFAKHIEAGYKRVDATTANTSLITTSFISPDNSKLTTIIVNNSTTSAKVYFTATGKTINTLSADQSRESSYYKALTITSPKKSISLPAKSITTVVMGI